MNHPTACCRILHQHRWLSGLILIGVGTILTAGTVAATAYGNRDPSLILGLITGALVTPGALLVTLEHQHVKRVERQWEVDQPQRIATQNAFTHRTAAVIPAATGRKGHRSRSALGVGAPGRRDPTPD